MGGTPQPPTLEQSLAFMSSKDGVDLRQCIIKIDQLPKLQNLEHRVKDLEDNFSSASNIATDLITRLTNLLDTINGFQEMLINLQTQSANIGHSKEINE